MEGGQSLKLILGDRLDESIKGENGKHKTKGDVCWYAKKYKRPIAYSTIAVSDAISLINQPHQTATDLMAILKSGKYLVSPDMIRVVQTLLIKVLAMKFSQPELFNSSST